MPDDNNFMSDDEITQEADVWKRRLRNILNRGAWIIIALIVVIYLAQGIYQVQPAEVGLVKRFGRHVRTVDAGLHYHLPPPVESVQKVDVSSVRKVEIGYETISPPPNPRYSIKREEALMLTGDDNIIHLELALQYTVRNPENYVFNIIDPPGLVKEATEAIIRQEVVKRTVEEALTTERAMIASEASRDLQDLLNQYEAGISVEAVKIQDAKPPEPVIPAFDDVTSAKENKQQLINEAEAYRNEILPKARGKAAQIVNDAKGYREERVNSAEGEVDRFLKILQEYRAGSQVVTRKRLYIETLENILPDMKKLILTEKEGSGSSVLKLLNLNEMEGMAK